VTGGWRKLHDEELHNSYSTIYSYVSQSRRMSWTEHAACMEEMRQLRRSKCRWKDNIKIEHKEIGM